MKNARHILTQILAVIGSQRTEREVDDFCAWIEVQVMTELFAGLPPDKQQQAIDQQFVEPHWPNLSHPNTRASMLSLSSSHDERLPALHSLLCQQYCNETNRQISISDNPTLWGPRRNGRKIYCAQFRD
jgi:hypothetical protein